MQVRRAVTPFTSPILPGSSPSRTNLHARELPDGKIAPRPSTSAVRPPPSISQSASFPVFSGHRRLRRRGPRSLAARERRLHRWADASSGARAAESRAAPFGAPDDAPRTIPRTPSASASRSPSASLLPSSSTSTSAGQADDCVVVCTSSRVARVSRSESHLFSMRSVASRSFTQRVRIWSVNASDDGPSSKLG